MARLAHRRTDRLRGIPQVSRGLAAASDSAHAEGADNPGHSHGGTGDGGKRLAAASIDQRGVGWTERLRALAFNAGFFFLTAVLGVLGLPLLLAPRRVVMRFGRFWARSVLVFLKVVVGLDCEIRGLGNVPPGPCVIAMKHQSAWDTLILPVVLGDPAIVLKRELLWVPFYGWYAARAGSIAIDRGGSATAVGRMGGAAPESAGRGPPLGVFSP